MEIEWERIDDHNCIAQVGDMTLCCIKKCSPAQEYSSWEPTVHLRINGSIMSTHSTHTISLELAKERCVILAGVMLDETIAKAKAARELLE